MERELKIYLQRLEDRVAALEQALENKPVRWAQGGGGGGGFDIKFGKVKEEWVAGALTVRLTPSNLSGAPTGGDDIDAVILPGAKHVSCLGAKVGDVLGYVSTDQVHYLFSPPLLPLSELKNHVITNIASDGQKAAWRAGFLRGR